MIIEDIIMRLYAKGVSKQRAHEEIRALSHQAGNIVKQEWKPNDLVEGIKANKFFNPVWGELDGVLKAKLYTERSSQIVENYCGSGGPREGSCTVRRLHQGRHHGQTQHLDTWMRP